MINHCFHALGARFLALFALIALSLGASALVFIGLVEASGTCSDDCPEPTASIEIRKEIDPAHFTGSLNREDFSFQIIGDSGVVGTFGHEETFELPVGDYEIYEIGPSGFEPAMWTILWAGSCDNVNENVPATVPGTITVTDRMVEDNNPDNPWRCSAENQYKPGTVQVSKVIVGTTSVQYTDFSFTVNDGEPVQFDSNGAADVDIPAGEYEIEEVETGNFTTSYSAGCTGSVANNENVQCVITNTYTGDNDGGDGGDNGGGNEGEESTYKVFGYVWHDANSNKFWDGVETEDATSTEEHLTSWTVTITNGSDISTTTASDDTGYYEFYVPAGTWTITETLQDGWSLTFPDGNAHVVEVIDQSVQVTMETSVFARIASLFVATAHAQSAPAYGPFNFGNFFGGGSSSGGNGGSGGGGGGSSAPRCQAFDATVQGGQVTFAWDTTRGRDLFITADGVKIFETSDDDVVEAGTFVTTYDSSATYELTVERGSQDDSCEAEFPNGRGGGPTPQVLGDQVSVVPVGAPDAGAGGAAPVSIPAASPAVAAFIGVTGRRNG